MIGALRDERYAFVPGEFEHGTTVEEVIGDLGEPRAGHNVPNHDPHVLDALAGRAQNLETLGRGVKGTFADLQRFFLGVREGEVVRYVGEDGSIKKRPGNSKSYWTKHAHVLDGSSCQVHALRCLPYTIRERARIQGFPDDFVFYGTLVNERGEWNHDRNVHMTKQTGKAMPIQFCRYVAQSFAHKILGTSHPEETGRRCVPSEPHVDDAKRWYCQNVGYSDQERACSACWLRDGCDIRRRIFGLSATHAAASALDTDRTEGKPTGAAPGNADGEAPRVAKKTRAPAAPTYANDFEEDFKNV